MLLYISVDPPPFAHLKVCDILPIGRTVLKFLMTSTAGSDITYHLRLLSYYFLATGWAWPCGQCMRLCSSIFALESFAPCFTLTIVSTNFLKGWTDLNLCSWWQSSKGMYRRTEQMSAMLMLSAGYPPANKEVLHFFALFSCHYGQMWWQTRVVSFMSVCWGLMEVVKNVPVRLTSEEKKKKKVDFCYCC